MDELDLQTCGLHFHFRSADTLEQDCETAVLRCQILKSPCLIFALSVPRMFGIEPDKKEAENPYKEPEEFYRPEHIDAWICKAGQVIGAMQSACAGMGIQVLYHNHAMEMQKGSDGRRFLDAISPDGREVDVYWAAKGLDGKVSTALEYVWENRDQIRMLHVKDGLNGSIFQNEMCGWGKGTYPIQDIIDCAKKIGISWVIAENDAPNNFGTTGLEDALQTAAYVRQHIRLD